MTPFDYSGRVIVYIPDYRTKINQEIRRVKNLSAKSKWCERRIDKIFQDNKVDKLNSIATRTMKQLNEAGVLTCGKICDMTADQFKTVDGISC